MLSTLLKPTAGNARVAGYDILKESSKVRENIGMVFQESILDMFLTGYDNLSIAASLMGLSRRDCKRKVGEVLASVGLEERARDQVMKYSGGMRRQLEIARAMLSEPRILFLDEPTLGLDPPARRNVWRHIGRVRERGVTVVLTTHYMEEAQDLCDRVAIIENGRLVADGSPIELIAGLGGDVVDVKLQELGRATPLLETHFRVLASDNGTISISAGGSGEKAVPRIVFLLQQAGLEVESVSVRKPNLEDAFIKFTGSKTQEPEARTPDMFAAFFRRRRH